MLANFDARSRNIPGTHQVRNTMRHQTHANRICYGTPLFVTFSPSERDTTLMLRLARGRQADPALGADPSKPFPTRDKPGLDVEFFELDPEALKAELPEYDERQEKKTTENKSVFQSWAQKEKKTTENKSVFQSWAQKEKKTTENKSVFQSWAQKEKKTTENKSVFQSWAQKEKKTTENKSVFQSWAQKEKKTTENKSVFQSWA